MIGTQRKCPPAGTTDVYTDFEDIVSLATHILFHCQDIIRDGIAYRFGRCFTAIVRFLDTDMGTFAGQHQLPKPVRTRTFVHRETEWSSVQCRLVPTQVPGRPAKSNSTA